LESDLVQFDGESVEHLVLDIPSPRTRVPAVIAAEARSGHEVDADLGPAVDRCSEDCPT
jgi:hypothetical protein